MSKIFVFGSNLRGAHGAGAAKYAVEKHGAVMGRGVGLHGSSYAIPTKDYHIQTLPLAAIKAHVDAFMGYAYNNPGLRFLVTAIGTGLAGYRHDQIAPLFAGAPINCEFPTEWEPYLGARYTYWGTHNAP